MKKLLLTLFTAICFVNVQAQCTSNPYLGSGSGGGGTYDFPGGNVSPTPYPSYKGSGNTPPVSPPQGQPGGGGNNHWTTSVSGGGGGGATDAGSIAASQQGGNGGDGGR